MGDKGWKKAERRFARDLGVERIPVTGERHGADFATDAFACQLKVRRSLPAWLFNWLGGICDSAEKGNKVGLLILKQPRARDEDAVVVVRWKDWVALHGDVKDSTVV